MTMRRAKPSDRKLLGGNAELLRSRSPRATNEADIIQLQRRPSSIWQSSGFVNSETSSEGKSQEQQAIHEQTGAAGTDPSVRTIAPRPLYALIARAILRRSWRMR